MKAALVGLVCAAALASPAAAANFISISPPAYDEAIFGTPAAPLAWTGGPYLGITGFRYTSHLHDARVVALELANATPGGVVSWYGQFLGYVADDGTFSLSAPIIPLSAGYDRQWVGRVRIRLPYNAVNTFDVVSISVTGFRPGAAPEPATWALMLLGFGGVGAMVRGRRARETGMTA